MNLFIKTILRNTRNEGWNAKGQSRYPNSECDAFYASESNDFLCNVLGWPLMSVAMKHHRAIWKAHSLADRCYKNTTKYFNHPCGRSYFNPKYAKAHRALTNKFYERIMLRELSKLEKAA